MKTKFELRGVEKLRMKLDFKKMMPNLLEAMNESTDCLKKETQKQAPYKKGKLRKSIKTEKAHIEGKRIMGKVTIGKFYAPFLEKGTKKHPIKPKRKTGKKAIKFDGIIRVSAMHPGIRARKFFEKAIKISNEKIAKIFGKAINKFWGR